MVVRGASGDKEGRVDVGGLSPQQRGWSDDTGGGRVGEITSAPGRHVSIVTAHIK